MSEVKRFQRCKEDFVCEHCSQSVSGDGYTNHCPQCLWSKHVDINPGDRAATCLGLMRPVAVTQKSGKYVITHRCLSCGFEGKNRAHASDNFEALLEIVRG